MAKGMKTGGRKAGTPNKTNAMTRQGIADFLDRHWDKADDLFARIAADDPYKAMALMKDLAEYHLPKLARTELTGAEGKDLIPTAISVKLVRPQ